MPSPDMHDWHHETFNENFGVLGVLDTIHCTNTKFLDRFKNIDNERVDRKSKSKAQ
jgi:sterol desaturase/sphingolipid hydroxylase (fatty acid hydroxylase superfamily)